MRSDASGLVVAGRTDTGVHAAGQVVHFDTEKPLSPNSIRLALNTLLKDDIRVLDVSEVSSDFSARFSAKAREYVYFFTEKRVPLILRDRVARIRFVPDTSDFQKFCQLITGTHDFICFRKKGANEKSTIRTVYHVSIQKVQKYDLYGEPLSVFEFRIIANGFLYRMVRNLLGALFALASSKYSIEDFENFFLGKESIFRYHAASARGLCLYKVYY